MSAELCALRSCRQRLIIETVTGGRVVVRCPGCERRDAGLCRDCPAQVEGEVGKAIRCRRHKHARRNAQGKQSRHRDHVRAKINARDRRRRKTDAAFRERRLALGRQWRKKNPEKKRAAARRLLLSEGASRETYLATQRRHNADPMRIAKKRAQAQARYYELHPERPIPTCRGCEKRLQFSGSGAPPRWCDPCAPPAEKRRRLKLGRSIRVIEASVALSAVTLQQRRVLVALSRGQQIGTTKSFTILESIGLLVWRGTYARGSHRLTSLGQDWINRYFDKHPEARAS